MGIVQGMRIKLLHCINIKILELVNFFLRLFILKLSTRLKKALGKNFSEKLIA